MTSASRLLSLGLASLVLINIAGLIVETLPNLTPGVVHALAAIERTSLWIFACEAALRIWSCTASPRYAHPVMGRLAFVATPLMVIDLLALAPFALALSSLDLRVLRISRILRWSRAFKLARQTTALRVVGRALYTSRIALATALAGMVGLVLVAATLMYYAEHDAQPEQFSSIPAAAWWAVTTLTTVGYGDVYPVTAPGKLVATLVAMLGIASFAIPTAIISSAITAELRRDASPGAACPACGRHAT